MSFELFCVLFVQFILCVLVADFITGFVHWIEDTYGDPEWPWIGKSIIAPNILHHKDQVAFVTMRSFLYRNYQILVAGTLAVLGSWWLGCLTWQFVVVAAIASIGGEVHAWCHKRPSWRVVRLLQDMKLITTPDQHAKHHRRPYDQAYCSITNVLNPILDGLLFWRVLELTVFIFTGVEVKRGTESRGGY